MEVYPQFPNYDKSIEKKPDQWSYVKLGLSTDHESIMEQMHIDFVMKTGRINEPKPQPCHVKNVNNKQTVKHIQYYSEFTHD